MSWWGRNGSALAIWLTVLAPLTLLPGLANRWLWPPLVVTVIAALLATFLPPRGRMPRALVISLGVAGVVFLVAALQGDAPLAQVFGRAPRYEGLPTLLIVCLGVWLGTRLLGPSALARELTTFRSAISTASILVGGSRGSGDAGCSSDRKRFGPPRLVRGKLHRPSHLGSDLPGTHRRDDPHLGSAR